MFCNSVNHWSCKSKIIKFYCIDYAKLRPICAWMKMIPYLSLLHNYVVIVFRYWSYIHAPVYHVHVYMFTFSYRFMINVSLAEHGNLMLLLGASVIYGLLFLLYVLHLHTEVQMYHRWHMYVLPKLLVFFTSKVPVSAVWPMAVCDLFKPSIKYCRRNCVSFEMNCSLSIFW